MTDEELLLAFLKQTKLPYCTKTKPADRESANAVGVIPIPHRDYVIGANVGYSSAWVDQGYIEHGSREELVDGYDMFHIFAFDEVGTLVQSSTWE